MNPTTPVTTTDTADTTDTARRPVAGTPHTPGPQPYGTWFSRWHHLYTETPTVVVTPDSEPTTTVPKRGDLTAAA